MDGADLLRAYYAAYNRRNEAGLRSILADDVAVVAFDGSSSQTGVEAYLETYRMLDRLFEDVMDPQEITQSGDEVIVALDNNLTARNDVKDVFGMSAKKGETIALRLLARYTLADGRIATIHIGMRE